MSASTPGRWGPVGTSAAVPRGSLALALGLAAAAVPAAVALMLIPSAAARGSEGAPATLAASLAASLVWASLAAWPAGALCARRPLALAALVPILVGVPLVLGSAPWAGAALGGLALVGFAAGRCLRRAGPVALLGFLLAAGLHALPTRGGLGAAPWPPAVAARALDLAPSVLVAEAAGFDWLRRPAVYGPAGADAIGPSLRAPWHPALAGGTALVLGCVAAAAALHLGRPHEATPWLRASSSARSPRS